MHELRSSPEQELQQLPPLLELKRRLDVYDMGGGITAHIEAARKYFQGAKAALGDDLRVEVHAQTIVERLLASGELPDQARLFSKGIFKSSDPEGDRYAHAELIRAMNMMASLGVVERRKYEQEEIPRGEENRYFLAALRGEVTVEQLPRGQSGEALLLRSIETTIPGVTVLISMPDQIISASRDGEVPDIHSIRLGISPEAYASSARALLALPARG